MVNDRIFYSLSYLQIICGIIAFIFLLFVSAPYGKHSRKGWGVMINTRYAWILMETPAVFTFPVVLFYFNSISLFSFVALALWELHYIYRTYFYSIRLKGPKKTFPVVLVFTAFIFNLNNGYINGYEISIIKKDICWNYFSIHSLIGILIFFSGFILHVSSDAHIRSLRTEQNKEYQIPFKGMFRFISNPNYLGEIIQWIGFAVFINGLAAWAFACFTFCNLFPRAISNHQWYIKHFSNYPLKRKIIIPFIY